MKNILIIALSLLLTSPAYANRVYYGKATWYGIGDGCSHRTASGKAFNAYDPHIAAHKHFPFGTKLLLTNVRNGRTLQVTVLDRGPFRKGVELDLTYGGRKALGFDGVGNLKIEVLN